VVSRARWRQYRKLKTAQGPAIITKLKPLAVYGAFLFSSLLVYFVYMNTREETIEVLRSKLTELHSLYGVFKIGLFGSFARGNPGPESDVDIIVEFDRPIGMQFMDFSDYLQVLFNRRVDVLTLAGINGIRNQKIAEEIRKSILYV
jgi:predicted nucleotidyltransferase